MSWDVMIFNLKQKVTSVEEIEDELFIPTDFTLAMHQHFNHLITDDGHREIRGNDFSINYFIDEEPTGNLLLHLEGENAIYPLIHISQTQGWQIFDTGNGEMINLEQPEINGYPDFKKYLQQVQRS